MNYIFGDFLAQRFKRERERERGFLKLIFFKLGRLDEATRQIMCKGDFMQLEPTWRHT